MRRWFCCASNFDRSYHAHENERLTSPSNDKFGTLFDSFNYDIRSVSMNFIFHVDFNNYSGYVQTKHIENPVLYKINFTLITHFDSCIMEWITELMSFTFQLISTNNIVLIYILILYQESIIAFILYLLFSNNLLYSF